MWGGKIIAWLNSWVVLKLWTHDLLSLFALNGPKQQLLFWSFNMIRRNSVKLSMKLCLICLVWIYFKASELDNHHGKDFGQWHIFIRFKDFDFVPCVEFDILTLINVVDLQLFSLFWSNLLWKWRMLKDERRNVSLQDSDGNKGPVKRQNLKSGRLVSAGNSSLWISSADEEAGTSWTKLTL